MNDVIFDSIENAILAFKKGGFLIVVDDEDRENEGDLIIAAEFATADKINFMTKHGRGLVCVSLTQKRLKELNIPQMVSDYENTESTRCRFAVSVDAKKGTTTGISAHDRATTVKALIDSKTKQSDLARPGHVFPLKAEEGGVLKRTGHTEAAIDLARLAGLKLAGVLCEIMNDDGTMARVPELLEFKKKHNIMMITIADLIKYRLQCGSLIEKVTESTIPTEYGDFKIMVYKNLLNNREDAALIKGKIEDDDPVLVRVHSECLTGDTFGSRRCDCGPQLHKAMEMIQKEGRGVILYLRQEGRGIGLANKIMAYALQDKGLDTVEANKSLGFDPDLREYGIGAQILKDIGVKKMRLMTNNPKKIAGLGGFGLKIVGRVPIKVGYNVHNIDYIKAKKKKMGHLI